MGSPVKRALTLRGTMRRGGSASTTTDRTTAVDVLASRRAGAMPAETVGLPILRRASAVAWVLCAGAAIPDPAQARGPNYDGSAPTCFLTAGGALEICREGAEAEGVLIAPAPCAFVRGVQILRLASAEAPGPLQAVFQGQSPPASRRRDEPCPERRATDPRDGGSLRTGRSPMQLATSLPPSADRFSVGLPAIRAASRRRRSEPEPPVPEGIGPLDPIAVSGRGWAGEAYSYVFFLGQESVADGTGAPPGRGRRRGGRADGTATADAPRRRVQYAARTLDFERFEIRTGDGATWAPLEPGERRPGRGSRPEPVAVLDEAGAPVAAACPAPPFETQGLAGSISVIDRTYHYFYTDALREDCGLPPEKRRTALYLRTAEDLSTRRVWSGPRAILGPLPPTSLVRVARAKGMQRWAVSYSCRRPANAPGGPVADICLQYTATLDLDGIGALTLYADPVEAGRSPAYLGLRSGGDGRGRFDRSAHFWMTDAQGNLDTPGIDPNKAGFLTWLDRLAPRAGGGEGSSLFGRPVYWATWTVRPRGAQ